MKIEIYLVGTDEDAAQENGPIFGLDEATQEATRTGGTVYTVTAEIDLNTIERAPEVFQAPVVTCRHCGEHIHPDGAQDTAWAHDDRGQLHGAEPHPSNTPA